MTEINQKERARGVLLANLGTPDAPERKPVARFLREFLSDPRVLSIPAPARWLLLHGVILRVRLRRSAAAKRASCAASYSSMAFCAESAALEAA